MQISNCKHSILESFKLNVLLITTHCRTLLSTERLGPTTECINIWGGGGFLPFLNLGKINYRSRQRQVHHTWRAAVTGLDLYLTCSNAQTYPAWRENGLKWDIFEVVFHTPDQLCPLMLVMYPWLVQSSRSGRRVSLRCPTHHLLWVKVKESGPACTS